MESPALRALVAAIPHVGGSVDAAVGPLEDVTKAAACRLQFMFTELHRQLRDLDGSNIQKDFVATEEWACLVRQAVARAAQTRDTKRLSAIARVLTRAATGTLLSPGLRHDPVDVLANTREGEALLAMFS